MAVKLPSKAATAPVTEPEATPTTETEPETTETEGKEPKVVKLKEIEYLILETLLTKVELPISLPELVMASGEDELIGSTAVLSIVKKGLATFSKMMVDATDAAQDAYENYEPTERAGRSHLNAENISERNEKLKARFLKKNDLTELPDGWLDGIDAHPTNLEMAQTRLAYAAASVNYNRKIVAINPYMQSSRVSLEKAIGRMEKLQEFITDELGKNPDKANAFCTSASAGMKAEEEVVTE